MQKRATLRRWQNHKIKRVPDNFTEQNHLPHSNLTVGKTTILFCVSQFILGLGHTELNLYSNSVVKYSLWFTWNIKTLQHVFKVNAVFIILQKYYLCFSSMTLSLMMTSNDK